MTTATAEGAPISGEVIIWEALGVIDKALGQMITRELISSADFTDVLLDVRSLLTLAGSQAVVGSGVSL